MRDRRLVAAVPRRWTGCGSKASCRSPGRWSSARADTVNPNLPTGEVELVIDAFELLSAAEPLPFPVNSDAEYPEDMRPRYRFLDLRRERVHANIMLRSHVIASIRRRMIEQGFTEFQTPILTASSPEGARDYLVPSRLHPGTFYALPQAPQQFKQLLMVAGFDRYFQIAPCFRDEASRADRSPGRVLPARFRDVVRHAGGRVRGDRAGIARRVRGIRRQGRAVTPAAVPAHHLRRGGAQIRHRQARSAQPAGHRRCVARCSPARISAPSGASSRMAAVVRAIPAPGSASRPRSSFQDRMDAWAKSEMGAPGLGYIILGEGERTAGRARADRQQSRARRDRDDRRTEPGSGPAMSCFSPPGRGRGRAAGRRRAHPHRPASWGWSRRAPSASAGSSISRCTSATRKPGRSSSATTRSRCRRAGWRRSKPRTRCRSSPTSTTSSATASNCRRARSATTAPTSCTRPSRSPAIRRKRSRARFGGMLKAFRYGAPPHGGSAPGIDRIVMLLADTPNIREIVAFPMNQQAEDLLDAGPGPGAARAPQGTAHPPRPAAEEGAVGDSALRTLSLRGARRRSNLRQIRYGVRKLFASLAMTFSQADLISEPGSLT